METNWSGEFKICWTLKIAIGEVWSAKFIGWCRYHPFIRIFDIFHVPQYTWNLGKFCYWQTICTFHAAIYSELKISILIMIGANYESHLQIFNTNMVNFRQVKHNDGRWISRWFEWFQKSLKFLLFYVNMNFTEFQVMASIR